MIIYLLFGVAATINYLVDVVVIGYCLHSNETLATNDSLQVIRNISVRSTISIILIFCTFVFFFWGLAFKQFRNTNKFTTAFLGGILVTHMIMWVNSFVRETSEDNNVFEWMEQCIEVHPQGSCKAERDYFSEWKPWLYPNVVEYCLITGSLTLRLWKTDHKDNPIIREIQHTKREDKRAWHYYSNVGIGISGLVTLPVIAAHLTVAGLIVHWQSPPHEDKYSLSGAVTAFLSINLSTSLLLITCFLVILQTTRRTGKRRSTLELEDYLTIVTGISVQIIAVFIFVTDMFTLAGDREDESSPFFTHVRLSSAKSFFDFFQGILQTLVFVYLKTFQVKKISNNMQRLVIMLCVSISAGINLILFLWATVFEGQVSQSVYASQVNVFGESTWHSIIVPLYPLVVFYRFHCFWAFIRFIEMIRQSTTRKMRHWSEMQQDLVSHQGDGVVQNSPNSQTIVQDGSPQDGTSKD